MNFNPHDYQKTAIDFIENNDRCALFLDMGLGKTVSTLTALYDLENEYKLKTANPKSLENGKSKITEKANLILPSRMKTANPISPKRQIQFYPQRANRFLPFLAW